MEIADLKDHPTWGKELCPRLFVPSSTESHKLFKILKINQYIYKMK